MNPGKNGRMTRESGASGRAEPTDKELLGLERRFSQVMRVHWKEERRRMTLQSTHTHTHTRNTIYIVDL